MIKQIRDYIAHWNANPKPFTLTVIADEILAKVRIVEGIGTDLVAEPNAAALVPARVDDGTTSFFGDRL